MEMNASCRKDWQLNAQTSNRLPAGVHVEAGDGTRGEDGQIAKKKNEGKRESFPMRVADAWCWCIGRVLPIKKTVQGGTRAPAGSSGL